MNKVILVISVVAIMIINNVGAVNMPMRFTSDVDPESVLSSYPLGELNQTMVLSHHGKEDKKIVLPNRLQAWIYDLSYNSLPKEYILPNKKKKVVYERYPAGLKNIYMLVFSNDGKVIDVIYVSASGVITALQLQLKDVK